MPVAVLLLDQLNVALGEGLPNVAVIGSPPHTAILATGLATGRGLMTTSNVAAAPTQLPKRGVTLIVAVTGVLPIFCAVNVTLLPFPLAARPTAVLLLDQVYCAPVLPVNATETWSPTHFVTCAIGLTTGVGLTVTVKILNGLLQPISVALTLMVAVVGAVGLPTVPVRLPVPLAGSPMAVLLLLQLYVKLLEDPVNATEMGLPPQSVTGATGLTDGRGLMARSKLLDSPVQPLLTGVTMMVAYSTSPSGVWLVKLMGPLPARFKPMSTLSLVQVNVAPGVPVGEILMICPAQRVRFGNWVTLGKGKTVTIKVRGVPGQPNSEGVTVMLPVVVVVTVAAISFRSPEPLKGTPVAPLLLVQVYVAPEELPVKEAKMASFAQTVKLGIGSTVGMGLTVMVKVCGSPTQLPKEGVTVMVPVSGKPLGALPVKLNWLPVPAGPRPMAGLSLAQV